MAKKKSAVEEEAEMNMTPMIDVTFQLLIFFIITLKFKTLEKKLLSHLPTDLGLNTSSEEIDENFVTVKLRQPPAAEYPNRKWRAANLTRFYFNDEKFEGTQSEIFQKFKTRLQAFRNDLSPKEREEARGKIDAGKGVPHGQVVTILDIFSSVGFKSVTFVGLTKNFNLTKSDEWWKNVQNGLKE